MAAACPTVHPVEPSSDLGPGLFIVCGCCKGQRAVLETSPNLPLTSLKSPNVTQVSPRDGGYWCSHTSICGIW